MQAGGTSRFWGAFEGETLRGMVGLERERRSKTRHKAKVVGMYVAPEVVGQGVGRALLDRLVAEARAGGIELHDGQVLGLARLADGRQAPHVP